MATTGGAGGVLGKGRCELSCGGEGGPCIHSLGRD